MTVASRTFTLLCIVVVWQCTFTTVESRPFNHKKHTTSPSKHRHMGHKNAVTHPVKSSSVRQLALGTYKTSKTITPFHFRPTQKQAPMSHHKQAWDALEPGNRIDASPGDAFGGPVAEVAAITGTDPAGEKVAPSGKNRNGFEIWGAQAATHPAEETFPESAKVPGSTSKDAEDTDTAQPVRQRPAGVPSKAIYLVPGQPPRIIEESFADGDFGTLLSSESEEDTDSTDGWFMSAPPYPEPQPTNEQSQSSSAYLTDMWGPFHDKRN